jgi:3-oxoacyl-[acyl-carrier-protein] synthase-1
MHRPVYLQGRALASALGTDLDAALERLRAGGVAPRPLEAAPGGHWPYFAIPAGGDDWFERARTLVAGAMARSGADALRDAPLMVASSSLNVGALEQGEDRYADCQAFVEALAGWLDWRGPVAWVSTACTSSLVALLDACALVQSGAAPQAVVLGVELFNRFSCAGFGAMQLLDDQPPRPLAADRGGLVLGEAVAALVVGEAPSRWRLRGGASRVDGSNPAGASREAIATMLRAALAEAALAPADIGLVKMQAAGSPYNDAEEVFGLRAVLDPLPPLATLKTAIGHTLGAAGAAELALMTACLEQDLWPAAPAIAPDPALGARCVDAWLPARHVLASILGFGGGHACMLLEDLEAGA